MEHIGEDIAKIVKRKRLSKRAEQVELIREQRTNQNQDVIFNSRPFVLTGLPLKRPPKGVLKHERRNGEFVLQVTGHPDWGLPFAGDRLLPIAMATRAVKTNNPVITFDTGAEILREFDLPINGYHYKRLMEGFRRVFTSTMFFGTEAQFKKALVWEWTRFHYFDKVHLTFCQTPDQTPLQTDEFRNVIVLSEAFWKEIQNHPIPIERTVVTALAGSPGCLDLYMWLNWRCRKIQVGSMVSVPLFGEFGLANQLGVTEYRRPRKFREVLEGWLGTIRHYWPDLPAEISHDGECLVLAHGTFITTLP